MAGEFSDAHPYAVLMLLLLCSLNPWPILFKSCLCAIFFLALSLTFPRDPQLVALGTTSKINVSTFLVQKSLQDLWIIALLSTSFNTNMENTEKNFSLS